MPNWCTNRIRIYGHNEKAIEPQQIIKEITSEENKGIDFNKILPMPQDLNVERSSTSDLALRYYLLKNSLTIANNGELGRKFLLEKAKTDTLENIQKELEANRSFEHPYNTDEKLYNFGESLYNNIQRYGCQDWYEWSIANWGTKWNANPISMTDDELIFDTAWSPAVPILEQLSKIYPNNEFDFAYAEEQISQYGGKGTFINGVCEDWEDYEDYSKELYELAFELVGCGGDYAYCEETKTYEYVDHYNEGGEYDENICIVNKVKYTVEEFDNKWEWNDRLETYTLRKDSE